MSDETAVARPEQILRAYEAWKNHDPAAQRQTWASMRQAFSAGWLTRDRDVALASEEPIEKARARVVEAAKAWAWNQTQDIRLSELYDAVAELERLEAEAST